MDGLPDRLLDRPAPEAARWLALARLDDLIAARPRLDDRDDPKALHDFRVALRRFRSLLRTYRPELDDSVTGKTRRRLGRMARASDVSRDSEVRLEWLRQHARRAPAAGVEWIVRELERDRIEGDRQLQRALDRYFAPLVKQLKRSLRCYQVTITLGEVPVVPSARDVSARALHTMATAIQETLEDPDAIGDPALLHQARIAAKRLRYLLELIVAGRLAPASVLRTAAAAIAQLERMQDELGQLHDELMFDRWLADRIAESPGPSEADEREAVAGGAKHADQPGDRAMRRTRAAFVATLRRRLQRLEARRLRTVTRPPWQRRTDRLIGRVHAVADRLMRTRRASVRGVPGRSNAPGERSNPTPGQHDAGPL